MIESSYLIISGIFMRNVAAHEQAKRVDINSFADVFGERLIPMQPQPTDYMFSIL